MVHHNNLRKEEFYHDNKHLKKDHIHRLASNIKFCMRKVLGIRFVKSIGMMLGDHRDKQVDNPARNYASLRNNKKRSHTQLDSRKQVIAFQDRVITINIKEAQHPLK